MRYRFGDYVLDTQRRELHHAGVPIKLRRKVLQVLVYLLAHRDRVVSKQELLAQLWPAQFVGDETLTSCLKTLRQALGKRGHLPADVTVPPSDSPQSAVRSAVSPVGREEELTRLHAWLAQARSGVRQVVFVTGDMGPYAPGASRGPGAADCPAAAGTGARRPAPERPLHPGPAWDSQRAVQYLRQAGQHSMERSAYVEAVGHLTRGLELLKTRPATPERHQQELTLHIALGAALQMAKGFAAPEVEDAYTRAYALCQQVGERPQLAQVLLGLWRFYVIQPQLHRAREIGAALLRLAQPAHDPSLSVTAHYTLGTTWFWLGAFPAARPHLEEGIARYTPDLRAMVFRMGHDPGLACRIYTAATLWLLGYPAQALARLHESLVLAHELSHPFSLAWAWCWAATVSQMRRDVPAVFTHADAAVTLSSEHGFPFWAAQGLIYRGWALAMQGQGKEGLAHTLMEQHEDRWWEAEVSRLRGVLLLRQTMPQQAEAETWLQRALDVARRQEAKSLELRAAMSLSRLCQRQGRHAKARELLTPIYGWFTEGFDTADLQQAKALLKELT